MIRLNNSEIINQKKQFIFNVEQTSNYVFPNEKFKYYIYIKNISGSEIEKFTIKIQNPDGVVFESDDKEHMDISIKPDEVLLYEMTAFCPLIGEYPVHFIGYGEGTQILYETLTIKCSMSYNSDKLMHRIHIYDFSPYEEKYSMEADNYSNEVTQIFKRQKLPYKAGEQPFPIEKDFIPENKESESFLSQYEEAKNTKEHVYQYISRENFTEDSIESYTGENLIEIFDKINKESEYFNAKFLRTGTNHLLNNFTQYAPNGFIYRMGLLNSEIYQYLGVIPTYSYMSDRIFRWAPSEEQLLSLTPKKQAMKWGENFWAGRGFFVYKTVTDEYSKTEQFKKDLEDKLVERRELIGCYEDERTAKEVINRLEKWDDTQRTYKQNDMIEYEYSIEESIYDTGVFFVNIPVSKIPSNFYLLDNESLYSIINRTKPYGAKPIINYVIEKTFNQHMDQHILPNYHKDFDFDMSTEDMFYNYRITENSFIEQEIDCNNGKTFTYKEFSPIHTVHSQNLISQDIDIDYDYSMKGMEYISDFRIDEESYLHISETNKDFSQLKDILETIYQGNYDNICFKFKSTYTGFSTPLEQNSPFLRDEYNDISINNIKADGLKLKIMNRIDFQEGNDIRNIVIEDILGKKHKLETEYDTNLKMEKITYTYINSQDKEFIRAKGYQNIKSILTLFLPFNNKIILLFMVEDEEDFIHYFHHAIVQDIQSVNSTNISSLSYGFNLNKEIILETPFVKKSETFYPKLIQGGENWTNLYRLNNKENTYSYIKNITNEYITPNDIYFLFDQINIEETSIIDKIRLRLIGKSYNKVYSELGFNTNYITPEMNGETIQLSPNQIECYSQMKESSFYYQNKLDIARQKGQENIVKELEKLLDENYIFDEDIDVSVNKYLEKPNDYITIDNPFWYELSEFTNLSYKLNEISSINFVIEGYNTGGPVQLFSETLSETNYSSTVKKEIPSGYFREKINLLYPNEFLLEILRIRFRFDNLNHNIQIFDTKMELKFKNKQEGIISYDIIKEFDINKNEIFDLLENYYTPANINNGITLKFSFEDLNPGDYYYLNLLELEIIYTDTDMNIMINNNKYQNKYFGNNKSSIFGVTDDTYLSGIFYDDVATMTQDEDNVGVDNKGIRLKDTIYQSFEARDDNITSIEIFPYGFIGNPDETIKIGLYTNSYNTPGKLIKEVFVSGWVKNNEALKNLGNIKYNININELNINEKYWFKMQVLNPQENSYYLLKGIDNTKPGFKLLMDENNNYINTFSNLKFNIYSKNLSQSFNNLPTFQDYFDNPYIIIGLHKGKGTIKKLKTGKIDKTLKGNDYMSEVFKNEISIKSIKITEHSPNGDKEIILEEEEE